MFFDEFCECTGDLSTSTEIEVKKHTKRSNLEPRRNKEKGQSHRRSIGYNQPIDRQEFLGSGRKTQSDRRSIAIYQSIDRPSLKKIDYNNADLSRQKSRSIGQVLWSFTARTPIDRGIKLIDRASIDYRDCLAADRSENKPINRQSLLVKNVIVF